MPANMMAGFRLPMRLYDTANIRTLSNMPKKRSDILKKIKPVTRVGSVTGYILNAMIGFSFKICSLYPASHFRYDANVYSISQSCKSGFINKFV
jgi:hypothetical protein